MIKHEELFFHLQFLSSFLLNEYVCGPVHFPTSYIHTLISRRFLFQYVISCESQEVTSENVLKYEPGIKLYNYRGIDMFHIKGLSLIVSNRQNSCNSALHNESIIGVKHIPSRLHFIPIRGDPIFAGFKSRVSPRYVLIAGKNSSAQRISITFPQTHHITLNKKMNYTHTSTKLASFTKYENKKKKKYFIQENYLFQNHPT